jgi:tetratricopeptide (TPR) repeat protein
MQKLTSLQAVKDIAGTLRRAKENGRTATLLIGAGVSRAGGIPLASELMAQVRREFEHRPGVADIDPASPHAYGMAMQCLQPNERRDLLRPHFQKAKVNWANVAVAQLLAQELIGTVLTVNFDPLLAKACALLGVHPAVYDFSQSRADVNLTNLVRPSIVHLHGQSYGFVLLNSKEETERHREAIAPVMRLSVHQGPLIVLGYSGGADGVFSTLGDCYNGDERLWWLGYDETPGAAVETFLKTANCAFTPKIDADRFLIELSQSLKIWPPKVFDAPVVHLLDGIETLTAYPTAGESGSTFDLLARHRRNLERMRDGEEKRRGEIEELEKLYLEGKYEDAAEQVERALAAGSSDPDVIDIGYWAANAAGIFVGEQKQHAAAAQWFERASRISSKGHEALNNWGIVLARLA